MELLRKAYPSQGIHLADVLYVAANAVFVTVLILLLFVWQLPALAFILAIFSKWRILAVRPRYWGINLRSNLVDIIFIASAVALAAYPEASTASQITWLSLLAVWLFVVKRLSSHPAVLVQAASALLLGLTALFSYLSFIELNQIFFLGAAAGAWLVGYAAARHALAMYKSEPKTEFFALLWGLISAEVAWVFSHWLQTYELAPGFVIPQVALILLLLSFSAQRVYHLQRQINDRKDKSMKKKATKRALSNTYGAVGLSTILILVILLSTDWTISI